MKIIAVDDEKLALTVLENSIKEAITDADITAFDSPAKALEYLKEEKADIVFCDYSMPKMNGIEFAKAVKEIDSKTDIVFVTGYDDYAIEAVNAVVPKGYILKPVSKKKILSVVGNLSGDKQADGLYIQCFGMFNVLYNGSPVIFKVKKAMELMAFLISSGGTCTRRELTATLYEDREEENAVRYLKDAVKCLAETLESIGCADIFVRGFNSYAIDKSKIKCDLTDYLNGDTKLYRGEYMAQYSWAEFRRLV